MNKPELNIKMKFCFHVVLLCAVLVLECFVFSKSDDPIGPADISIDRVEECENPDEYQKKLDITMNKLNRTHAGLSGCFDFGVELGTNSLLNITAAKWGDGGWKPNALNYVQPDVCETLKQHVKDPWNAFLMATGHEHVACPLPKDSYCFEKLIMPLDGLFPNMLYGKFRVDATVLVNREPIMCIRSFIKSFPSKS